MFKILRITFTILSALLLILFPLCIVWFPKSNIWAWLMLANIISVILLFVFKYLHEKQLAPKNDNNLSNGDFIKGKVKPEDVADIPKEYFLPDENETDLPKDDDKNN